MQFGLIKLNFQPSFIAAVSIIGNPLKFIFKLLHHFIAFRMIIFELFEQIKHIIEIALKTIFSFPSSVIPGYHLI